MGEMHTKTSILDALSKSSEEGKRVADVFEAKDRARVEAEQAAKDIMLSFLRSDEVKFVTKANEGFGNKPYGVMGERYITASLDREEYLAVVISLQRSKLTLQIPKDKIFVVTQPSDNALDAWKAKIVTSFGGGRLSAEELMRRNCVIAVNSNSDGFRDDFMDQLVKMNETFFKQ